MTKVIGFGFMNRSGKDTAAAEIIKQRHKYSKAERTLPIGASVYDIRRYGFGDALKAEVNAAIEKAGNAVELFHQMDEQLPEWVVMEDPDMTDPLCPYGKFRTLLQFWGSEYRRGQNPRYWIERLEERIYRENPEVALISDVRYSNELSWIKSTMNGYAVHVHRPEGPTGTGHQSEKELAALPEQAWSATLYNHEEHFDWFKENAVRLFDELMARQ